MKSETLIYGKELLVMLDEFGKEVELPELEQKTKIKGDELKELLKYLDKKGYLKYNLGIFITNLDNSNIKGTSSTIKLLPKGMEIVLGKRDYFSDIDNKLQNIQNQANIYGNQNQLAQTTGDNSSINQIQDNSKINILKQIIEDDKELDETKKKKLFGILDKFNTLKQSGENAYELIKQVGSVAVKYVPLFFGLIH